MQFTFYPQMAQMIADGEVRDRIDRDKKRRNHRGTETRRERVVGGSNGKKFFLSEICSAAADSPSPSMSSQRLTSSDILLPSSFPLRVSVSPCSSDTQMIADKMLQVCIDNPDTSPRRVYSVASRRTPNSPAPLIHRSAAICEICGSAVLTPQSVSICDICGLDSAPSRTAVSSPSLSRP